MYEFWKFPNVIFILIQRKCDRFQLDRQQKAQKEQKDALKKQSFAQVDYKIVSHRFSQQQFSWKNIYKFKNYNHKILLNSISNASSAA